MPEDQTVPEFNLPDWGTEGAPPEPAVPDEGTDEAVPDQIEISVERSILLTAGPLPPRWEVRTVHGLVTGHAKSDKDDHVAAVESATSKAMAELSRRAVEMGANAVTDVTVTTTGRKSRVVATVWGTAISFSR